MRKYKKYSYTEDNSNRIRTDVNATSDSEIQDFVDNLKSSNIRNEVDKNVVLRNKELLKIAQENVKASNDLSQRNEILAEMQKNSDNLNSPMHLANYANAAFFKNAKSRLAQNKVEALKETAKKEIVRARQKRFEAQEAERQAQQVLATTQMQIKKLQETKIKEIEMKMKIRKEAEEIQANKHAIPVKNMNGGIQKLKPKEIKEVVHWKKTKTWWLSIIGTSIAIIGLTTFFILYFLEIIVF